MPRVAPQDATENGAGSPSEEGISRLIVQGFKSLAAPEPYEIEIRPLTLLAGANSSGKSSALQPLLLMKQTLEASFDPGPLLLDGPHVRFTSTEQLLPVGSNREISFGVELDSGTRVVSTFVARSNKEIELSQMLLGDGDKQDLELKDSLGAEKVERLIPEPFRPKKPLKAQDIEFRRQRCFLKLVVSMSDHGFVHEGPSPGLLEQIQSLLHVPGLRGNPERSYRTTGVGELFPGTFETYVASIVHQWQKERAPQLKTLGKHLEALGLTWKVDARQLDATKVELKVGRLPKPKRGGARDLVNIADVGFGVSQTLPVVVALLTARPGQLVYLEQPELHLHPRAQVAMAELLADAARRGVRVVAETHSALLLLAVQSLVAEDRLDADKVLLHWFQRDGEGITRIATAKLDEQGAYGDWPEDFGDVQLDAQGRYMDAVEARLFPRSASG